MVWEQRNGNNRQKLILNTMTTTQAMRTQENAGIGCLCGGSE